MIELYMSHGLSEADATSAISILARYPDFFIDIMMAQELKMPTPDAKPLASALCLASGFAAFFFAPVLALWALLALLDAQPGHLFSAAGVGQLLGAAQQGGPSSAQGLPSWLHAVPAAAFTAAVLVLVTGAFALLRKSMLPLHRTSWVQVCAVATCLGAAALAYAAASAVRV